MVLAPHGRKWQFSSFAVIERLRCAIHGLGKSDDDSEISCADMADGSNQLSFRHVWRHHLNFGPTTPEHSACP